MSYFYGGSFKGSSAPWWSKASDIVLGTLKGSICKHVRFYSKNKGSVIRRKIRKSRQSQRARCEIEGAFTEGCGCEWWNFVKWNGPKIMWLLLMLIFSTKPTSLAPNMTWNYYSLIQFLSNELWNFLQGFCWLLLCHYIIGYILFLWAFEASAPGGSNHCEWHWFGPAKGQYHQQEVWKLYHELWGWSNYLV